MNAPQYDPRDDGPLGLCVVAGIVAAGGIVVWLVAAVLRVLA